MANEPVGWAVELTRLENGIYQFVFKEATTRAVDEWLTHAEWVIQNTPPGETILTLYDNTQAGMLPMNYGLQRSKEIMRKYPNRPPSRVAFLFPSGFIISLVEAFVGILRSRKDAVRFFQADRREEAIAWLLRDK